MKAILKQGLRYWHLAMVGLIFVFTYPFVYYFSRKESRYPLLNKVRRICALFPSVLSGFLYKVQYEEPIDWGKTYIFCPNHASNLDIFTMSVVIKNNFFFLGKDELLKNPATKIFFETIDIPLKRESNISAFRAFKKTSERIEAGMSPIIFPEGKIGEEYPPILHHFKSGPFRLAIEHQIAIVPVTIKDNWKLFWDDGIKYGCKPGVSHICIHKPIETIGMDVKDDEVLKQMVYDKIASKLDY
ncbi:1-acyl-sn-glycerol-3-phosphate acyltransferase [Pedobacter sp. SD-b]|uniref:1-acyl-sn-glycerol-3-phosphate acyltransferase n=1 Tax=Pedobacter segetis TaxID=2793069 RepID=A0ABS1BMW3_9SPHI|nr:lysophospholipid acyltransferase family protein [Pedobacter segetis]MBK0384220.1 1-acyl-sn-glycerol-3-phosphate acyltransferase [Pedobacter segetis]